jgi:nucleoside-diphosphate-sugar epimerase
MNKKVLITGGSGYLGSVLVNDLLKQGFQITVLDNFMYGQSSLNQYCSNKNFNVVNGDVRDKICMKHLMKSSDVIIPLAAFVGAPLCKKDPVGAKTINYDAIMMMLELKAKSQSILMPTTNSAYGSGNNENFCNEESPLKPISQYAIDKVAIEKELMQHENVISFRLATVFGMSPRMRIDLLVNDFVYRAVYDKFVVLFEAHFKRNYIHIKDVSRVFQFALDNFDSMKNEIFNVGLSSANISKAELCEKIKSKIQDFIYLEASVGKDPDQRNYIVSNKKIESKGFEPIYDLDDGILELIKGYTMIKNTKYGNV